jgi:hypothetical protein
MKLIPRHVDVLQLKLKESIKASAAKIIEKKAETADDLPQTLESFIYGHVTVNQ